MTVDQIKEMICEQIITTCENIIHDIECLNYWQKQEDCDHVIERYETDLKFHKGQKAALGGLYQLIKLKEENEDVQQSGIPDQADDSVESLD